MRLLYELSVLRQRALLRAYALAMSEDHRLFAKAGWLKSNSTHIRPEGCSNERFQGWALLQAYKPRIDMA